MTDAKAMCSTGDITSRGKHNFTAIKIRMLRRPQLWTLQFEACKLRLSGPLCSLHLLLMDTITIWSIDGELKIQLLLRLLHGVQACSYANKCRLSRRKTDMCMHSLKRDRWCIDEM